MTTLSTRVSPRRRSEEGDRDGSIPPWRYSSLYTRVVAVNASILAAAVIALTITPATVSSPATGGEWLILGVGLAVLVVANAALLRLSFRGLTALVRRMETLDLLQPQERLPEIGGVETRALIVGYNRMLARLEVERRASMRRTISGMEAERSRIGMELHDEIGQRLTGLLLQLGGIHDDAPDQLRPRVEGVRDQARSTLDEVGALAYQVRPAVLADLGLRSGLGALADSFRTADKARIDLTLPSHMPSMTTEAELAVYRIAQEALTNALRHSDATRVAVVLELLPGRLDLQVTDDGRGMCGGEELEGQGLRGMRERAVLIGGRLRIESPPLHGVRVHLTVPTGSLGG